MYYKIPALFADGSMTITNSPHGTQNKKAIDFKSEPLICPFGGSKITAHGAKGTTGEWFDLKLPDGSIIRCVHGTPVKSINGIFNAGEIVGNPKPSQAGFASHWHLALQVAGKWEVILDYIDRRTVLALSGPFKSQKWKDWSTWNDRSLLFKNEVPVFNPYPMPIPPIQPPINIPVTDVKDVQIAELANQIIDLTNEKSKIKAELDLAKIALQAERELKAKLQTQVDNFNTVLESYKNQAALQDLEIQKLKDEIKNNNKTIEKEQINYKQELENLYSEIKKNKFSLGIFLANLFKNRKK